MDIQKTDATVLVIDDDKFILHIVNEILKANTVYNLKIHTAQSAQNGLEVLEQEDVDLILLDIVMPEIDGLEMLDKIRTQSKYQETPVIMMSATMKQELEADAFRHGATDFIHKPFTADVINLRIERQLTMHMLQTDMKKQVAQQTKLAEERLKANLRLFNEIVTALAKTIDAKDPYTRGHSIRVAEYARTISRLSGDDKETQNEIYYTALLHDIGKIGIPENLINKPDKLSEDEYTFIQQHTKIGAQILSYIKDFPSLAVGAHYHHERYDGTGYPEGLKGEQIPRTARIISVADTYDSMTSKRSYRDILPQAKVKQVLEDGLGTQFDPEFGKIMLRMIEMDKHYQLHAPDNLDHYQ